MGDGGAYVVKHPDFIASLPGARAREIYLYTEGPDPETPVSHRIDLSLVLEIVAPAEVVHTGPGPRP
jgi:hypothetical protein